MSDYVIAGDLILQDFFSDTLDRLRSAAQKADQPIEELDRDLNKLGKKGKLQAVTREVNELNRGLRGAAKTGMETSAVFRNLIASVGVFGISFGMAQIARGVTSLINLGAEANVVRQVFDNLTKSYQLNASSLMVDLRRAARGAILDLQLMKSVNIALQASGTELAQSLPKLLELARAASAASGQLSNVGYIYDTLILGIVRGSPKLIDNANVFVKVGDSVAEYARKLGKSAEELSAQERQLATLNAVLKDADRYITQAGLTAATSADKVANLTAAIQDLKLTWGDFLTRKGAPDVIQNIADALRFAAGTDEISVMLEQLKDYPGDISQLNKELDKLKGLRTAQRYTTEDSVGFKRLAKDIDEQKEKIAELIDIYFKVAQVKEQAGRQIRRPWAVPIAEMSEWNKQLRVMQTEAREATQEALSLAGAIARLNRELNAGISTEDKTQALTASIKRVESSLLGLVDILDSEQIVSVREKAISDLGIMVARMGDVSDFQMREMLARWLMRWDELAAGTKDKYRTIERDQRSFLERTYGSAGGLQSMIEKALGGGVTVTAEQMRLTGLGLYEDQVQENARRLQAVVERGFSELSIHPDWAAMLKIPESVLQGSEAQLKAWAIQTRQDVVSGLRPDLINWDAFINEFKRLQDVQITKKLTVDIAVQKLQAAGMLDRDTEEIRKQIAEQLGLEAPKMTIETLFRTEPTARQTLLDDLTNGEGALTVPVRVTIVDDMGQKLADVVGASLTMTTADILKPSTTVIENAQQAYHRDLTKTLSRPGGYQGPAPFVPFMPEQTAQTITMPMIIKPDIPKMDRVLPTIGWNHLYPELAAEADRISAERTGPSPIDRANVSMTSYLATIANTIFGGGALSVPFGGAGAGGGTSGFGAETFMPTFLRSIEEEMRGTTLGKTFMPIFLQDQPEQEKTMENVGTSLGQALGKSFRDAVDDIAVQTITMPMIIKPDIPKMDRALPTIGWNRLYPELAAEADRISAERTGPSPIDRTNVSMTSYLATIANTIVGGGALGWPLGGAGAGGSTSGFGIDTFMPTFLRSIEDQMQGTTLGKTFMPIFLQDQPEQEKTMENVGTTLGQALGKSLRDAVKEQVSDVRDDIIDALWPELESRMQRYLGGRRAIY